MREPSRAEIRSALRVRWVGRAPCGGAARELGGSRTYVGIESCIDQRRWDGDGACGGIDARGGGRFGQPLAEFVDEEVRH